MEEISYFENIKTYKAKKGEEFMNKAQTEHFKNKLNMWKQQLLEEANDSIHHMQDDVPQVADVNDRATLEEEFTIELKTRDRERKLIDKINKSLRLIDLDEYGYCDTCGVEISLERLEARPTATQCIDCKIIEEKKSN